MKLKNVCKLITMTFKIFFITTNKYNKHLYNDYWFVIFLKGGETHTHIYRKNHVDFKYVYLQIVLLKKKKKNLQDIIVVQMYEIMKIQMHSQSNYLTFWFKKFHTCVNLGKIFKNEIYLFSFGQSMKNIIIVKVGYFCMGQRMMWKNVVNLSHVLYQQVEFCKLYN
jgi:hypothetical protein